MDRCPTTNGAQEQDVEGSQASTSAQMRPLLHNAALVGDEDKVKKLIASGIDLNELDFTGCTGVQLAAAAGHYELVQILLAAGACIANKDTSHGNTALHEASWRGYSKLVKFLSNTQTVNVQNKGGFTPSHLASQAGHNQCIRELLLADADPNIANTYGDTALHTAVRYGHAGVTRILLSARALTDIRNKNGDTPLHISSAMGRKKLTKILLSAGCLPHVQNNQHESPLDISIRKGFEDVTSVLQNPPTVVTPIERDAIRASKYKYGAGPSTATTTSNLVCPSRSGSGGSHHVLVEAGPTRSSKRSNESSKTGSKSKSTSSINRVQELRVSNNTGTASSKTPIEEVPKWSPYGCHNQPSPGAFPPPNIDSLPSDPLRTGELYYLDLAGNIHKGPMGVSEGCYCGPTLLSQARNSQSLMRLDGETLEGVCVRGHDESSGDKRVKKGHWNKDSPEVHVNRSGLDVVPKYEDQLKSLTHQLSKIHFDTQAQLSSLHSMLNERLKTSSSQEQDHEVLSTATDENEVKLKEWVRQYRRFRKELAKNPKTLQHANDLLASASTLLSARLASPAPPDSETDSGL